MTKRLSGAGVNRSAARKAAEVAALRRARAEAHEKAVTEAVAVFFDRSGRAEQVRAEAQERARRILADGEEAAAELSGQADDAVMALKRLKEKPVEIAGMLALPITGVRAALTRVDTRDRTPQDAGAPAVAGTDTARQDVPPPLDAP